MYICHGGVMKRIIPVLVIVMLAGCVAGCAAQLVDQRRTQFQNQCQPPAYIDGYLPGCDSGTIVAGNPWYAFKKDKYLYKSEPMYSKGWNDGFQMCLSQKRVVGN
jgi:hypothetical protein